MGKDFDQNHYYSHKFDNHKIVLGAGEELTYVIPESGTDSGSSPYTIYFGFERPAFKVTIRATVACSITEINGRVQKSPITINPNTNVIEGKISTFKLVSSAATVLEVSIK